MSIRDTLLKIKGFFAYPPTDIFIVLIIILVGSAGFGLGRLSVERGDVTPVTVVPGDSMSAGAIEAFETPSGAVVASKAGTKYHFPWCPGAQQINEANKIAFASTEEARAKGYTPAANCKGLE